MNADGSGERRLTRNPGNDFGSAWSPDGRRIAFGRGVGGTAQQIYVMNADGSGQRRLTRLAAYNSVLAWLPDGKIAFVSSHGQRLRYLRHERRRQRTAEPDPRAGARRLSGLVARRAEDRLHEQARRQLGALRHERRRQRAAEADAQRARLELALLPGRPTGGRSPSDATATAAQDEIYVINADGSGQRRLTPTAGGNLSGRQTGRRSPSRASATATTTSTS